MSVGVTTDQKQKNKNIILIEQICKII